MGRHSDYTESLADMICQLLMDGNSLKSICEREDMPDKSTVYNWLHENREGFFDKYVRAREIQSEQMYDELVAIADSATGKNDADAVRVRVQARQWVLSKIQAKRFGDKLDVTSKDEKITAINLNVINPKSDA